MKKLTKRYQYWWWTGEGYALEEFDDQVELLDLISDFPASDCYLTKTLDYLPSIELIGDMGKKRNK
jgi:hypothetical protein